ncbi:antibiotic biosynthesis monooxygenase [Streptomyces sp. NPDC005573]|uniref:putative quinol monooxygenase n=1 Tax=Streptomyces sp. NPDC005573 TaxID=3156890 RepID=UPI0033B6BD4D
MSNFGLFVRFTLRDGAGEAFDELMRETTAGIQAHEPGTLVYACHQVEGAPNERIFYELYADLEAFEEHERQPHTLRFLAERSKHVEKTEVDRLQPYTGKHPTGVEA